MKHKNMLKGHDEKITRDKGINCKGKVIYLHDSFYDDVNWGIYYCPECDSVVSYISDGHNWNYTHKNPLESSLEKGRRLSKAD